MTREEEIERVARNYENKIIENNPIAEAYDYMNAVIYGAKWADSTILKRADGDDLPEIDREVIALVEENGHYKVVFAHRPPEYWDGRNILTDEITRNYTKRYDKGEWNQPNVKWWLDINIEKLINENNKR